MLTWALSPVDGALPDGRLEIALRLGGALWRFWFMRGDLLEGEHWLETALARVHAVAESPQPPQHAPPVPPAVRASAHTGAGEMAWGRGDIERPPPPRGALALRRALDDPDGVAQSLHNLGNLALERGDYGQARALHGGPGHPAGGRPLGYCLLPGPTSAERDARPAPRGGLYGESLRLFWALGNAGAPARCQDGLQELLCDPTPWRGAAPGGSGRLRSPATRSE